jgi:hypothetical protein
VPCDRAEPGTGRVGCPVTANQVLPDGANPLPPDSTNRLPPDGANRLLPDSVTGWPLSAFIDTVRDAVKDVPEVAGPETGYRVIARLSGHLAAMWRTVYPFAAGERQLRADCLGRARAVEWTLRRLECRLAGDVSAAGVPVAAVSAALARHLDGYWPAERALVARVENRSAVEVMEKLARDYRRALAHGPTRPHPRCPRSGPMGPAAFWLHRHWDRLLDTVDSWAGVGQDFLAFLAHSSSGHPGSPAGEGPRA